MSMPCPQARRAAAAAVAAVAATLLLTACGGKDSNGGTSTVAPAASISPAPSASASAPAGQHNQADVTFAQGMIPHHRQAILMADMVQAHSSSSEVKALAEKIKKAQAPEIETMTNWLKSWGEPVPQGTNGMGMGRGNASTMPGMMDDQEINKLKGTSGNAFDTMFLTMMIVHHEGAIQLANTEKQQGAYGPAKELADSIVTSQTAQIAQMRTMLGTSSPSATSP